MFLTVVIFFSVYTIILALLVIHYDAKNEKLEKENVKLKQELNINLPLQNEN